MARKTCLLSHPFLTLALFCILGAELDRSALAGAAQAVLDKIPAASDVLSSLRPDHPRLLASSNDFSQFKARVASDPQLKRWHEALHNQGQALLDRSVSKYEIPDGLRLLATSRHVLDRVYTLALLYRIEGDSQYLDRAWKELDAAANFPDWNPRHFLDTAEMTHAFAIGYDWLFDAWTHDQREALKRAIVEKGLTPALKVYRENNWWARARHNWNQVCNGGIGMGALALADVEPKLCGEILHDALSSLPLAMAEFAPDGAWAEGPGYWNYATSYNVVFLAGLQTALGTDFGLSNMPGFAETGLFPLYLTGPLGRTFNYADGGDHAIHAPQMFWLAQRFQQPVYAWYEVRHAATPAPLDLLWHTGEPSPPKPGELPLAKYFRNAEVAFFRSDWQDSKAWFVGFKAGDNKANHSHLDLGSFVLDALGARWAVDLGADDYNLEGYFGRQRWEYYRLRAEGQNTLLINPDKGPDQDPSAASRIISFKTNPERSFAIADLTAAYKKHAQKVHRGISLAEGDKVLVQDEVRAQSPAEVWWFMHTPANVSLDPDRQSAVLNQLGVELRARILSPPNARFEIMDAAPLSSSPNPEKQATNKDIRKLAIHLSGVKDLRLAVEFSSASTQAPKTPKIVALDQW